MRMAARARDHQPQGPRVRGADAAAIAEAAAALRRGELIAFPTETVYGLGANALDGKAVARVFAAKRRPRFNPLIIHLADMDAALALGDFGQQAQTLGAALWPGPLTLVVEKRADCPVCDLATAGLATIALRVPAAPVAHALIEAAGVPVAAPSANLSGQVSATTAAHVAADLGDAVAMVLDGGPARHGIESTIVRATTGAAPQLLRAGAIETARIEAVLGCRLERAAGDAVVAPGQLESHYAPRARLRLNARRARAGEVLIAFGPPPPGTAPFCNLSPAGDLVEAAANLYSGLRRLDEMGIEAAAVMPIPEAGLGEAINDRLARAAAPRRPAAATEHPP